MNNETRTEFCLVESSPVLSAAKRLQYNRGYRDSRCLFFVEGVRNFIEAVDHGFEIHTLLYSERLLTNPIARKIVRRLKRSGVSFARVTPEQFREVSITERASGVGAIVKQRVHQLNQISPGDDPCWTALRHIRSLGNLGALMRTSAAAGAAGFFLMGDTIDPFDPAVVRASMGAIFRQKIVRTTPDQLRCWLDKHQFQVIGAAPYGDEDYRELGYTQPVVLMLGSERKGLDEEQRSMCQRLVRIPMVSGIDSLNVAVAGGLLMYEVFRPKRE